jgi:hypothetical protein
MPTALVPPLHDAYASLLHRLTQLQCPHVAHMPTLAPSSTPRPAAYSHATHRHAAAAEEEPPVVDIWNIPDAAHAHAVLAQQKDEGFHASAYKPHLLLRLALVTWLLEQYDADLLKLCHDLADEYQHTRNQQSVLYQFKKILKACLFIGVIPPSFSSPLHLLTGTATAAVQLTFFHTLVDLIYALPRDTFYASHSQYHSAPSYAPSADPEHLRHVHLLQHITNTLAGGSTAAGEESVMSERMDLYPPTLMMAANANRSAREKLKAAHGIPDVQQLALQLQSMRQQIATKALVLEDLRQKLPLTSSEDYTPSLTRLESSLSTLSDLLRQFAGAWEEFFWPMVEPLENARIVLSPLGAQLSALASEKQSLDTLLSTCSALRSHYTHLLRPDIRRDMARLAGRPELQEKATLKLNELVKTFTQSLSRLSKASAAMEERRELLLEEVKAPMRQQWKEKEMQASGYRRAEEMPREMQRSPIAEKAIWKASLSASKRQRGGGGGSASKGARASPSHSSLSAALAIRGSASDVASESVLKSSLYSALSASQSLYHADATGDSAADRQPEDQLSASVSANSAAVFSASILTSNRHLPEETEPTGSGSSGLFSPVLSSPLPLVLVTRTGAFDESAQRERWHRRKEEERERVQREREVDEEKRRRSSNTPSKYSSAAASRNTPSRQQPAYSPSSYADSQRLTTAQLR